VQGSGLLSARVRQQCSTLARRLREGTVSAADLSGLTLLANDMTLVGWRAWIWLLSPADGQPDEAGLQRVEGFLPDSQLRVNASVELLTSMFDVMGVGRDEARASGDGGGMPGTPRPLSPRLLQFKRTSLGILALEAALLACAGQATALAGGVGVGGALLQALAASRRVLATAGEEMLEVVLWGMQVDTTALLVLQLAMWGLLPAELAERQRRALRSATDALQLKSAALGLAAGWDAVPRLSWRVEVGLWSLVRRLGMLVLCGGDDAPLDVLRQLLAGLQGLLLQALPRRAYAMTPMTFTAIAMAVEYSRILRTAYEGVTELSDAVEGRALEVLDATGHRFALATELARAERVPRPKPELSQEQVEELLRDTEAAAAALV